tara:strand:- start:949 stop:1257 length:309 start_codon:yes stop_codon:yes gene_type:complete
MKKAILDSQTNYQNATSGANGIVILLSGNLPVSSHEYFVVTAETESTISFDSAVEAGDTYADQSVSGMVILAGQSIVTGPIKNLTVTGVGAKVSASLLNRPK